jgi:tetratricopeptide (TPR) repeat protein
MLSFSKRLIYTLSNKIRQRKSRDIPEGKYTIDFAKINKSPFDIKAESSYYANLSKGALELGVKKENYIAWVDIPEQEYEDHIIEAKYRLDSLGGYAAAGIIFHVIDDDSYYLTLVSSKGYFRMDLVKNGSPKTLIAWTDISDFNGTDIRLKIITYATDIILIVNDKWLGEINDGTLEYGRIGFALASYSEKGEEISEAQADSGNEDQRDYICKAMLDYISIETRTRVIENEFKKWTDDSNINAENRLRLAETYAAMDEPVKAIDQIRRAWKRRDEVILTVSATAGIRTKRELLLAARMAFRLGHYSEADEYLDAIIESWAESAEAKFAYQEKLKVLYEQNKYEDFKDFIIKYSLKINKNIDFYTMLGRCHWELEEYTESAEAWDRAFEFTRDNCDSTGNGVYAANAANAYENTINKKAALARYIDAGKIFLSQDNMPELAAIMPKLSLLGEKNYEARSLVGKWAFSIEDYKKCANEFEAAHKIRCALKPRPKADPALYYLWGLLYYINGKNKTAIRLIKRAVRLAPDYELFRKKLEEIIKADAQIK